MQNPYAQSIFKKPKTQTNSLGLQQSPPIHEPTPSKKKYKRALRINNSESKKYLLTPLSFFSCNFQQTITPAKKPCRILNWSVVRPCPTKQSSSSLDALLLHTFNTRSSLHCESGDPKHQPETLINETEDSETFVLNKLKESCNIIWSRQTLTTTRRAPKPYYCIELQKKFVINRTVQQEVFSTSRSTSFIQPDNHHDCSEADQALEKSRQSLIASHHKSFK